MPFELPWDTLKSVLIAYEGKDSSCETKRFLEGVRGLRVISLPSQVKCHLHLQTLERMTLLAPLTHHSWIYNH